jgi:hypothetical protein
MKSSICHFAPAALISSHKASDRAIFFELSNFTFYETSLHVGRVSGPVATSLSTVN